MHVGNGSDPGEVAVRAAAPARARAEADVDGIMALLLDERRPAILLTRRRLSVGGSVLEVPVKQQWHEAIKDSSTLQSTGRPAAPEAASDCSADSKASWSAERETVQRP